MSIQNIKKVFIVLVLITVVRASCSDANLIDKYRVNMDSLLTLPNNFYAYRDGGMYLEDLKVEKYRVWFNLNNGEVPDISKVEYFRNKQTNIKDAATAYAIDTSLCKLYARHFIKLSKQYRFSRIYMDRQNEIIISYSEDLSEQYVRPVNDSIKQIYTNRKTFRLLKNGWFGNTEQ